MGKDRRIAAELANVSVPEYIFAEMAKNRMKSLSMPLRVVFYKDEADWVAHCLEFDLCGHGRTKLSALKSLSTAIQIQIEQSIAHDNPANLFTPADGEVFQRFAAGRHIATGKLQVRLKSKSKLVVIEGTDAREYTEELSDADLLPA